jgi:hypothetical protein
MVTLASKKAPQIRPSYRISHDMFVSKLIKYVKFRNVDFGTSFETIP